MVSLSHRAGNPGRSRDTNLRWPTGIDENSQQVRRSEEVEPVTQPKGAELLAAAAKLLRAEFEAIRQTIPNAGEKGLETEILFNRFLNDHLPKRFGATRGFVVDTEGAMSPQLDTIIYDRLDALTFKRGEQNLIVPHDNVAAVVQVKSRLDAKELQSAAKNIAAVKRLEKADVTPMDEVVRASPLIVTTTRGIVFAYDSVITLERAGEVLGEINTTIHSDLWIDELVVLDKGTISYAMQGLSGGLVGGYNKANKKVLNTPIIVVPVITEQGAYTLSQFMVNLSGHLTFYRRKNILPFSFFADPDRKVMTLGGYWCRTDGALVPIPETMYKEKYGGPAARVEVSLKNGKALGAVEWMPWADGHAIFFFNWGGSIPVPVLKAFTEPYGKVALQHFSPNEICTDVKPGPRPEHFEAACKRLTAGKSPFVIKRVI